MSSTETQGADAQAIRANKLALVERLADDLGHEIKNPLHSMVINLEVLRRRISRLQENEQGDLLRYAGVLGGELDRVTRQLDLLLRLVRSDRTEEPTTLTQTVEEMLDLVDLERERHRVRVDFDPAPHMFRGDLPREPVRQLTLNLLLEALDVIPAGGTLSLRTEVVDGRALLHLRGSLGEGGTPPDPDSPRMAVVRALAEGLNGELHTGRLSTGDPASELAITLTLPIPA